MNKLSLIAFLAIATVAFGDLTAPSVTSTSFNSTPVSVFDSSASTDTLWVGLWNYASVEMVPATTNDTIYVYGVNWTAAATNINIIRRTLNASTVAIGNTSDVNITTSVQSALGVSTASGLGYLAFTTVNATGASADKIWVHLLSGTATSVTSVDITGNTDSTLTYIAYNLWYEDNYFYLIYSVYNSTLSTHQGLYLQAVAAASGTKLYTSSMAIATFNITAINSFSAGGINYTNSSTINVCYTNGETNATILVPVNATSGVAGTATTLKTDSYSTNTTHYCAGHFGAWNAYGLIVRTDVDTAGVVASTLTAYFNGSTTGTTLNFTGPSNGKLPSFGGWNYIEGFALLGIYATTGTDSVSHYLLQNYFANGTANGTQMTVGSIRGDTSIFADANGTLWFGYTKYDDNTTVTPPGNYTNGYLGKLQGQIYQSANVLATFFSFLALLVAALFAF